MCARVASATGTPSASSPRMNPFRSILVATDFGPSSERALALAAQLAERDGATLTVLHVLEPHTGDPETLVPLTNDPSADAPWERETRARLDALRGVAPIVTDTVVRMGEPWKTIVEEAEARDVDLVVVGTHGRTSAKRWLLGSVAERVVRECKRPVLTVHADDPDETTAASPPARDEAVAAGK